MWISNISIIVAATSPNLVIGKDNTIPWHLPTDLKYFKKVTDGSTVVMGRKSWESLPVKYRPLPNRRNIVVTRNSEYIADGAEVINSLVHVIEDLIYEGDKEIFIIGGAQIYREAFNFATKLYLTRVLSDIDGDTKLEGLNLEHWEMVHSSEVMIENDIEFKFEEYKRRRNDKETNDFLG